MPDIPYYDEWKTKVPDVWDRDDYETKFCHKHNEVYLAGDVCPRCDAEIDRYLDR